MNTQRDVELHHSRRTDHGIVCLIRPHVAQRVSTGSVDPDPFRVTLAQPCPMQLTVWDMPALPPAMVGWWCGGVVVWRWRSLRIREPAE